ncbi:MAG: hypothetical protein ACI8WT_001063 [Clostridium sp.]|jgi:hypothetical protein
MNRKRILSLLLTSALTFTGTSTAFAQTMTKTQATVTPIVTTTTNTAITTKSEITTVNIEEEKSVKITKEKAKEIAKEIIKTCFNTEIDESKFTQRCNLYTANYNGVKNSTWNISWDMSDMTKSVNISVSLNAETGEVTQLSNYERAGNEANIVPTLSAQEAEKISDDFIKKIQPEKYTESIRKNNNNNNNLGYYGSANYNFNYSNKVNGVEFDGNNISVEVDGVSGKVVSYYSNWTDELKFPEVEEIIDSKTAADTLKNEAKMNLKYTGFMQNYKYYDNIKDIKLVYVPEFSKGNMVDAKDGKILDQYNNSNIPVIKDLSVEEKQEFYNQAKVLTPRDKAIEEVEAEELIKGFINKLYGDGYVIQDLGYQESTEAIGTVGNKTWNASFNKGEAGKNNEGGYVSIDALTGGILNFNKYSNEDYNVIEKFIPKLSWEDAYAKALEVVAQYYPDKVKQIKTEQAHYTYNAEDKMGERAYYFNFTRLEDGIEYNENSINVGFSAVSGEMNNLYCSWDKNIKFPENKNAITKENASDILFDKYKPVLIYTQINKSVNLEKQDMEMKLAYKLVDASGRYDYINIDALTGKFINYNGEDIDQNIELFKEQIKNSKAEKELSILASRGLIDTVNFKLDKKITQIDLIKMLVNGRGYNPYMAAGTAELKFSNIAKTDANYKYLQVAVSYGIMENSDGEFIGDQLVTREQLAKTLVKFTNYSKLAEHSEIFNINYSDASKIGKGNLGYVAIAEAFGFIQIENNEFKPSDNVTMEQLALGVYNALNNARGTGTQY